MKVAVVYYSGTGNTEAMADVVRNELAGKAEVSVIDPSSFAPGARTPRIMTGLTTGMFFVVSKLYF